MTNTSTFGKQLPAIVRSYRVTSMIFDSAMYSDYTAEHECLGYPVKFRHERWPNQDDGYLRIQPALEALKRSRSIQASLRHPNIIPVEDFFEHQGEWFTVFFEEPNTRTLEEVCKLMRGGELAPFKMRDFLRVCEGIASALSAIHQRGYVHRTISSQSVLLNPDFLPFVADMGCAIPAGPYDEMSAAIRFVGIPLTAAPESFRETGSISQTQDVWALGVTLYRALYNRHPYAGTSPLSSPSSVAAGQLTFPTSFRCAEPEGHRLLQSWLTRMLERDPNRRPRDASEVLRDLKACMAKLDDRPPVARAFVAMPFSPVMDSIWRAIEAICLDCNIRPVRVDEAVSHDNVWDEICFELDRADLLIALVSSAENVAPNPNVMLEIGYMRALKRPIVVLIHDAKALPFDLRTHRSVMCTPESASAPDFHAKLARLLRSIVERIR